MGDTMHELYLIMQAVGPVSHYVIFFSCVGTKHPHGRCHHGGALCCFDVSVGFDDVVWWSGLALGIMACSFDIV